MRVEGLDSRETMEDPAGMSKPAATEAVHLPPAEIRRLQTGLLAWYGQHQRRLPWRESRDFYPVWVSEVMLQQTQVQTVVPYFLRFMKAFPTLEDLAEADTRDLLRIWAGLGYYSRARNLQKTARILVREHGGKFPGSYREALRLPGIGRYTAAAILSIAFDLPLPALDGNVVRVLSRLFCLRGDPAKSPLQGMLAAAGQQLLPAYRPGDFNQALMELGATVCLPRNPRCLLCPWSSHCEALKSGMQERLPEKGKRSEMILSRQAAGSDPAPGAIPDTAEIRLAVAPGHVGVSRGGIRSIRPRRLPGETDTRRTGLERSAGFPFDHHQARRHQSENHSDGV